MRINENTAVATTAVLLVPYEAHHVLTYHGWMQDPVRRAAQATASAHRLTGGTYAQALREATASEALSLAAEYENQRSWRMARDKLTFIVCEPLAAGATAAAAEQPRGDVNLFLHAANDGGLEGEVGVMIGGGAHRGRGLGGAAVRALLAYLRRHGGALAAEHGGGDVRRLVAKIGEANAASRALFARLGFAQRGGVDFFGEVTVVLDWADVRGDEEGYRELAYADEVERPEREAADAEAADAEAADVEAADVAAPRGT